VTTIIEAFVLVIATASLCVSIGWGFARLVGWISEMIDDTD